MKKEYQELLLKDLCARLPFRICANLPNHHLVSHKYIIHDINIQNGWTTGILDCAGRIQIYGAKVEDIKPYLRPMSSMTEEEKNELGRISCEGNIEHKYGIFYRSQDYLNSIHVAYRTIDGKDMFELGLALEAPEGMYQIK